MVGLWDRELGADFELCLKMAIERSWRTVAFGLVEWVTSGEVLSK